MPARVTVVVLCVCMCMYVYVSTHTCRLTHWNHKREIPTDSAHTGIVLNADFPKNASFKSYGVICLLRAAPASYRFFPHEIRFYAGLKPIATFLLHRQRACGRQRAILWHRLVKRHRYTDHEY